MVKSNSGRQLSLFEFDDGTVSLAVPKFVAEITVVAQAAKESFEPLKPIRNLFVLQDEHLHGLSSDASKVSANLRAIEIVKSTQSQRRILTCEEKAALAAYVGWGGLSNVFAKNTIFVQEQNRLKQLLGSSAYSSAMESVLTAYYTEPEIIRGIWNLVRCMGFTGGRVLEPSCGAGHFIGAMPEDLRLQSHISMVEIDEITANIAGELYADCQTVVYPMGLQDAPIQSGSIDLVVGNVPFGNYRVADHRFDHLRMNIHDYFFAKCLDALRPDGVMCLITSTWTMDKSDSRVRKYLSERANLVCAIRLPTGAFKRLGGTDVVADVLILKKKSFGDKPSAFFEECVPVPRAMSIATMPNATVNQYFAENPKQVLGMLNYVKGRFGTQVGVVEHADWKSRFDEICSDNRFANLFDASKNLGEERRTLRDKSGLKGGAAFGFFFAEDGQLVLLDEHSRAHPQSHLPAATYQRIEGMTRIRDAALELLEADAMQLLCASEKRQRLNDLYGAFVKRYGFLMNAHNRRLFAQDSHAPLVWSLESWDEESETAVKADVFMRSTVSRAILAETAETLAQAMAISFNRFARFDLPFVAKALGRNVDEVLDELVQADMVYQDPSSMQWIDSESYLSGEVYEKLDVSKAAQFGDPRFERNVRALQAILPIVVPLSSVAVRLGVSWIDTNLVEEFVCNLVDVSRDSIQITHLQAAASWSVEGAIKYIRSIDRQWGTTRRAFHVLLSDLLNQRNTEVHDRVELPDGKFKMVLNQDETIAAREIAEKIQTNFERWIYLCDTRVRNLENVYNRTFNGRVNRKYDGSHLIVPGLNSAVELRQAQKDAIWRGLVSGNTLFAQAVGGGKTLIQICLTHEIKRLGIANKPCLVVPNHMLEAFAGEYLRAFPRAKVLAASKDDLAGDRRRTLLMRAAMHDWDCIIITHGSFGRLSVGKDEVDAFVKEISSKVEESIMGATDQNAVRDAMRQKKQIEAKLQSLGDDSAKDCGVLSFDKLGIDFLCVDEADLFKNLWFHTKKTRVSGLSNTCSGRALDLLLKSRLIFRNRGYDGAGLCFATATPIANTIAEMFIMQTYLHPWTLEKKGLGSFDVWAANFAREVTAIEVKPEGSGYRMHTRFARFVNVPELMLLFREVAEIRTKKELALPEPKLHNGSHTIVSVPASHSQKRFVESLVARADAIRKGQVKPNEDNMLCVTNDGRKGALDMRCLSVHEMDYPGSKVNACVQRIFQHWSEGKEQRLTQLVFSDLSVPSNAGFSVYRDIRTKLIDLGVPQEEIAFAQDFDTDKAKAELHRKVRQGVIRVLIGSTELMGFGTNVQDRLVAKHDLDAPWRPRDVEQRDGRIIRQKNRNEVVHIYRYVTEQTFDAYMWQTLERKAGFIAQVMEHTGEARTVEDVTSQALSFAEVKALASGNPLVIEKAGVDAQVARLTALKSVYMNDRRKFNGELRHTEDSIKYRTGLASALSADLSKLGNVSIVEIDGYCRSGIEAGQCIMKSMSLARELVKTGRRKIDLMRIGNAAVSYEDYGCNRLFARVDQVSYEISIPYGAENIAKYLLDRSLDAQLRAELAETQRSLFALEKTADAMQQRLNESFEHEMALQDALKRQAQIDAHLEVDAQDQSLVGLEDSSD